MPNVIKWIGNNPLYYNNEGISYVNYRLGCSLFNYGPTEDTNYWNGITPGTFIPEMELTANFLLYHYITSEFFNIYPFNTLNDVINWLNLNFNTDIPLNEYDKILDFIRENSNFFLSNKDYEWELTTENLILYIDSFHFSSYPRVNNKWYNLVGPSISENNGILSSFTWSNNIIFFSENEDGGLTFSNFSNEVISSNSFNGITVEIWLNVIGEVYLNNPCVVDSSDYKIFFDISSGGILSVEIYNDTIYQSSADINDFTMDYHQICFTCKSREDIIIYVDGTLNTQTEFTGNTDNTIENLILGSDGIINGIDAGIPIFRIYNRVLSGDEINKNYIVTANRF